MKTRISTDILSAKRALEEGKTIGIPTETVYGLAANALNQQAVESIFTIKGRPLNNPLILHFFDLEQANPYIQSFHSELLRIMDAFCPGPITFLVPKSELVPSIITAGQEQVAIRFPSQPLLRELLSTITFPIAAPSANKYGRVSPTTASQVVCDLNGEIPLVLDGGPCDYGLESTIIGIENSMVVVYRLGSIPLDELAVILGYIPKIKDPAAEKPLAPGMVKYHYAPETPLYYLPKDHVPSFDSGYIFLHNIPYGYKIDQCMTLSSDGDLKNVARNLYRTLIEMDSKGFSRCFIEKPVPKGLGLTIIDRMDRATAKFNA